MDVFSALAESRRRDIIEMLAMNGQLSASEISKKFNVTPSAISQHLKILREAEIIKMEKRAQQRIYKINPSAIEGMEDWINRMKKLWDGRFQRLQELLEEPKNMKDGDK